MESEMSKLPRLKVISPFKYKAEIYDMEQAKDSLFRSSDIPMNVIVEGQLIHSYEELVQLAAQDEHKNKEMLNVMLIDPAIGGG